MANVGGGWMADYDVVPLTLPACAAPANSGRYTTYEDFVPALVSASADEYLRVTRLFGTVPWATRPDIFLDNGKPHVSDMLALKYLSSVGDIQEYVHNCGVIEASLVFDGAGGLRCRENCPKPPQPGAHGFETELDPFQRTWGPLGAHFSHAAINFLHQGAVATSPAELAAALGLSGPGRAVPKGDGAWMTAEVVGGLMDMHSPRMTRSTVHIVRSQLLTLALPVYRDACPMAFTGDPSRTYVTPPGIVENFGQNCHATCDGDAGLCPTFCGPAGACCRKGTKSDNVDPSCGLGTQGCESFHCCVRAALAD